MVQCLAANESSPNASLLSPSTDGESPMDYHEFCFPDEHEFADVYFVIEGQGTCEDAANLLTDAIGLRFGQVLLTATREAASEEIGEYRYSLPDSRSENNVCISIWNQQNEIEAERVANRVFNYLRTNKPEIEHHERFSTNRNN